jgi:hypothetical protein
VLFDAGYGLLDVAGGSRIAAGIGGGLFQFWR